MTQDTKIDVQAPQDEEIHRKENYKVHASPQNTQQQIEYDFSDQNAKHPDGIRLDFQNICLDVKVPLGKKRILNEVSGFVQPGEMLYIMGPSGGGKTTLLDYLCNRTKQSPQNNIYINGKKWTEKEFKKIAKYCQQHPQLYEVLTVQETLEYAASFATQNNKQRNERVESAISLLGLENQRSTKIGGIIFRGISGGQQKRVSVGEQLVANPKLLFLDEPTSGLDSASAFQLMEKLKNICHKTGISIIASIHQPSQRVFDISDRLLILAGGKGFGGNVAYFGLTKNIDQYFHSSGIDNHSNASTSEWVLDQVNGDFSNSDTIQKLLDYYKSSEIKQELNQIGKKITSQQQQLEVYKYKGQDTKQGVLNEILTLLHRGFKNTLKNPLAFLIRIFIYCFMALIIGSVWWQVADEPDAGDVNDINGVLFFSSAFFTMMSISVLPLTIEDRMIMVKERTNGAYMLGSYSLAQILVGLPQTFILSLLPGMIVFFMVGFQGSSFWGYIFNMFMCVLASEALMVIIGSIFSHLLICIVVASQIVGSFMIMNGFFIRKNNIPGIWMWLHYSAFNTYTFQNFVKLIFDGITISKNLDIVPPAPQDFPGKMVIEDLEMEDTDELTNYLLLIGFVIIFRLSTHFYTYKVHNGKK